jgi:regulator of sigma E protease
MMLFAWGEEYLPNENVTYGYMVDSLGMEMGLENGDKILSLDGEEIDNFLSIVPNILLNEVKTITVERDGTIKNLEVPESIIPKLIKSESPVLAPRYPFEVAFISDDKESVAYKANLQPGDKIVSFNGDNVKFYDEVKAKLNENIGKDVVIGIERDSEIKEIQATIPESGMIGVGLASLDNFFEFKTIKYGFFESIPAGISKGFRTVQDYLKQFKLIFKPETKAYESLGGFLKIGSFFPGTWDWHRFWNMTAFLSIILAVMNILPIPALDGGHVTFLLYEMVSGRKPGDKFLEYAQLAGMIILLSLLVFANGNDIVQLIRK